jgi:hypothetical protein
LLSRALLEQQQAAQELPQQQQEQEGCSCSSLSLAQLLLQAAAA